MIATQPLVSVVIPARNAEATIIDSVRSALDQTHKRLEVIVVENGSTDATVSVLAGVNDPRVSVVRSGALGASAARNVGIRRCTGDYIGFLDADDLWHPERVVKLIEALERQPDCSVSYSWIDRIENGIQSPHSRQASQGNVLTQTVQRHLISTTSNLFVRASVFGEVDGFDESLDFTEDWDLLVRLAARFRFVSVEEALLLYRRHAANSICDTKAVSAGTRKAVGRWEQTIKGVDHRRAKRIRGVNLNRFLADTEALTWVTNRDRLRGVGFLAAYAVRAITAPPNSPVPSLELVFVRNCLRLFADRTPAESSRSEELLHAGMVRQCGGLSDPSLISDLLADEPLFADALVKFAVAGEKRVPYIVTPAIARVAFDPNLAAFVTDALGSEEWVMWGANIRTGVPNSAQNWHIDAESRHWQSLTVVVGLAGCHADNATHVIPRSHRVTRLPPMAHFDEPGLAIAAARSENPSCRSVETFEGFGNGRFYAFDANCWHAGDPDRSDGRVLLFTHFQLSCHKRVPLMGDFRKNAWLPEPSPYISSLDWPDRSQPPPVQPGVHSNVERRLARFPRESTVQRLRIVERSRYAVRVARRLRRLVRRSTVRCGHK